jgi:hypothetical protein
MTGGLRSSCSINLQAYMYTGESSFPFILFTYSISIYYPGNRSHVLRLHHLFSKYVFTSSAGSGWHDLWPAWPLSTSSSRSRRITDLQRSIVDLPDSMTTTSASLSSVWHDSRSCPRLPRRDQLDYSSRRRSRFYPATVPTLSTPTSSVPVLIKYFYSFNLIHRPVLHTLSALPITPTRHARGLGNANK